MSKRISVKQLAEAKMLSEELLRKEGVRDSDEGVRFTYYTMDGKEHPRYQIRTSLIAKDGTRWNSGSAR